MTRNASLTLEIGNVDVVVDGDVKESGNGVVVTGVIKKYVGRKAKVVILKDGA